ncbi:hypothetical protein KY285_011115 [Solanum tuberosum]|nr:hypothetical protein KY289_011673 [Solanum tuberosum]KAH0735408.1 hypothetical protein KY285_011115 [Solanum tuberosum]
MSDSLLNLYESVENLKDTYIQPNQCKDILLKPKSSAGISPVPFLLLDGDVMTRGAMEAKGGFVTYMVADDLVVKPMSTISCIALLNKFNGRGAGVAEGIF